MKKIVSGLLAGMMLISSSMVFAGTVEGMSSATKKPVKVVNEAVEEAIEEDQIVTIQDQAMDSVGGIEIGLDISAVTISTLVDDEIEVLVNKAVLEEGVLMLPLAESLRNLGYEVKWNSETSSVDITKGAQWTSVKGGVNAYTKNRMAPMTLSVAPTYINGVTYVPAEFFSKILDLSFTVDSGNITLGEDLMAIHEGFVKDISYDETGGMTITLTAVKGSEEIMDWTIIYTSKAFTYYQKEVKAGEWISAVSPAMMTMSLPGQTSAYIIY